MLVPKGTEAQSAVPVNGHIRYNTDDDLFEAYPKTVLERIAVLKNSPKILVFIQQNLGNGDATETVFGPIS